MDLTQERLKQLVTYDPITGLFTRVTGEAAGHRKGKGYLAFSVDGTEIYCHRLAWLYMTGEMPELEIDHKNRNRADNSWDNLRLATSESNKLNTGMRKDNKSGFKGVSWSPRREKWVGKIRLAGKVSYVGYFDDVNAAGAAVKAAREKLHGDYANQ